jgi:N-methylhydantoinase B
MSAEPTTRANENFFLTASEITDQYGLDMMTAENVRAGLIEVTRQMRTTVMKGAFSNVVREIMDFAVCVHRVFDDGSTEMVAITEGCSHFAFTHPHMANIMIDEWGIDNLGPGDTLVCNDPFRGSIHFPDVNLVRPVFVDGRLAFVLTDASHLVDIGGAVPGGFNNAATSFFEEGLRIPPMLITSGDKVVRSTVNLILENSRTPMHNLGDLRALFGTLKVGEQRLHQLIDAYGIDAVTSGSDYALDLAERRMRAAIHEIPDGVFEDETLIDEDGLGGDPIRVQVAGRVVGTECEIDFSGTDRQGLGATTTCWEELNRCLVGPKVILDPIHPMNSGAMRPFQTAAPPGSLITGLPPTSASQHSEIGTKVASMMVRLFGQMLPERAVASDSATSGGYIYQGIDSRSGREGEPFGGITVAGGGWGGTSSNDGISHCCSPMYNTACTKVEYFERDTPLLFRGMGAIIDSAGAGQFRSGYPDYTAFECLAGEASMSSILDGGRFAVPGLNGGGAGAGSFIVKLRPDGDGFLQWNGLLPTESMEAIAGSFADDGTPTMDGKWCDGTPSQTLKISAWPLKEGERIVFYIAGGGGYGDPLARDPELVRLDVWNELVSPEFAREGYGVVVDEATGALDTAATEALRAEFSERQGRGEWAPPGAGRREWPATREDLVQLSRQPPGSGSRQADRSNHQ